MSKSIIQEKKECYECHSINSLQNHHCIHGAKRKFADQDGLTVYLCIGCHKILHSGNSFMDKKYKKIAQRSYMKTNTLEEFVKRYNQNYLWDEE